MKKLLLLGLILLLAANTLAFEVNEYDASFNIVGNKVVVNIDLNFDKTTDVFKFELPKDNNSLSVYVDDKQISPLIENNLLKIQLNDNSKISFNYVTEELIEKTNFLMNMRLDFNVDDLKIKLILPEGASLKKAIKKGDLTSGSIFPKPTQATTDGRSAVFYWHKLNLEQGDEVSIFTQIEAKKGNLGWILSLTLAGIIVLGLVIYIVKRKPVIEKEVIIKKEEIIIEKEYNIEKHLKEDEEQIITILKNKEGSCEQGTLRVITGFSKASLSRLLSELEARNVIHKEKRGKKNLVFLKK
jgi:uncharacterized membrane protein